MYEGKSISEIARSIGMNPSTLSYRLRSGMSLESAISIPVKKGGSGIKTQYNVVGNTYTGRFGNEFVVLGFDHRDNYGVAYYKIRFKDTGYEMAATSSQIRNRPMDRLAPTVHGVGAMGYAYIENNPKLFDVWRAMIARYYNPKNPSFKTYGAKGVKVCERWKRFDWFLEDIVNVKGYDQNLIDAGKLCLDKDIINHEALLYSPETCCFVTRQENTSESATRTWNEIKCRDYSERK